VLIFIGHSLVREKLAPPFTKLIDARLAGLEPRAFESPDCDAPRISKAFVALELARRTWPVCTPV
jgi:hypothetical protein